jgi:LytS/YehU family sensor histidine kinase
MQLAQSRLSALQAQMNPHFIFNSISSIQNYVMSNRREEAYDYLTAFSKLIRKTLHNSRSQFITLSEELETLQLYMQLETRRYNERFDFQIQLDPEVHTDQVWLPASLIQPLLENAVWHGMTTLPPTQPGHIVLRVVSIPEGVRIVVTDNGTGAGLRNRREESLAITMIEEQLVILQAHSGQITDTTVSLYRNPETALTEVSFTIPRLRPYESITD